VPVELWFAAAREVLDVDNLGVLATAMEIA